MHDQKDMYWKKRCFTLLVRHHLSKNLDFFLSVPSMRALRSTSMKLVLYVSRARADI
jgi:hypothetical protein